jgi:hydroxypyruvate isomerase
MLFLYGITKQQIDHKDYQCDKTSWEVELAKRLVENFKLLLRYLSYAIDEGDIIRTIKSLNYIAHYHTAGVPGRNEIDETQELNYSGNRM